MKILSIGNSFSQDAQRYFHQLSKANGKNVKCVNLYIGGCSLRTHYLNALNDEKRYSFELNGEAVGLFVTIKEALCSDEWDYITLQQASPFSYRPESYVPYLTELVRYVKIYAPGSTLLLHKTWAYPDNQPALSNQGFSTTCEMFHAVDAAYNQAQATIHSGGLIPSGDAMLSAYEMLPDTLYRDPIHASFGFGRYLLANVWYKFFFGQPAEVDISEWDAPLSEKELECVHHIMKG